MIRSTPQQGHNSGATSGAKARMDRIIRLLEEVDAIKGDIRDIYAEEKAEGGDKTAMGSAITYIRKRDKDRTGLEDREAMTDVYLSAYDAPSHTHAREGNGSGGERTLPSELTTRSADESVVTNFPAPPPPGDQGGDPGEPSSEAGGEERDGVDAPTQERAAVEAVASSAHSERAADQFEPVAFLRQAKPIRPHCLHPGDSCGGYGSKHCNPCLKAAGEVAA